MPISETTIANRALDLVGAAAITDLASDKSPEAKICQRNFELTRDATYRSYAWNSCLRRARLIKNPVAPAWGYATQFVLPSGADEPSGLYCLRVLEINGERRLGVRYSIEGRNILTNEGDPLDIRYIARVTAYPNLDPMLAEAVAARLSLVISPKLTESAPRFRTLQDYYIQLVREARSVDAQEGSPTDFGPDPAIEIRGWLESRF
jgi:hypothetical protein